MNGWIRLGIVASIIWMIVGGFWANLVIVRYENNFISLNSSVCRSQKEVDVSRGVAGAADRDCWAMAYNDPGNAKMRRSRWEIPILGTGPAAIRVAFWLDAVRHHQMGMGRIPALMTRITKGGDRQAYEPRRKESPMERAIRLAEDVADCGALELEGLAEIFRTARDTATTPRERARQTERLTRIEAELERRGQL